MKKSLGTLLLASAFMVLLGSCSDCDETIETITSAEYTVEHYKQALDGTSYTIEEKDTQKQSGTVNARTAAEAKEYEGFIAKKIEQQDINPNGKTIVKIYYDRKEISVTFDFASGTDADGNAKVTVTGLYGSELTAPTPTRNGYFLASWEPTLPQVFQGEASTFIAQWQLGEPRELTYELNGGSWNEDFTPKTLFSVEDEFSLPDSSCLKRTGYEFAGWYETKELEGTVIDKIEKGTYKAKTLYAAWNEGIVNYTVRHFFQNENTNNYEENEAEVQTLQGKTNETTAVTANEYNGFHPLEIEQQQINADGSTVVKVYYDRAYLINYDLGNGVNAEENPALYTDKDLPLTLKTPVMEGYNFFGWEINPGEIISEIPSGSKTAYSLKALWCLENETYYLVRHNLQTLEDANVYNFKEKNYCVGTIGSTANPAGKGYEGFSKKSVTQKVIEGNGSTVVDINYERKTYEVRITIKYDDIIKDSIATISGKYQEQITGIEDLFSNEYEIDKCEPSYPTFFGENYEYTVYVKSKYEYYKRPAGNDGIKIGFICRDFKGYREQGTGDGFITKEQANTYRDYFVAGRGHPDFERCGGTGEKGIVYDRLGEDGLPVFQKCSDSQGVTKNSFDMWYRDYPGINITFPDEELVLRLENRQKQIYRYSSDNFFPINDRGYGTTAGYKVNGSFTDEMTFYFAYDGSGKITFTGDDDVWIFINGKLAIDLGGLHSSMTDSVDLTGTEVTGLVNGQTKNIKYNPNFNISEGQMVEVKIFHAERMASGSNFTLLTEGLDIYERKLK